MELANRFVNNYLECIESFGPFERGQLFYCVNETAEYLWVHSQYTILGVNEFKISTAHRSKFKLC